MYGWVEAVSFLHDGCGNLFIHRFLRERNTERERERERPLCRIVNEMLMGHGQQERQTPWVYNEFASVNVLTTFKVARGKKGEMPISIWWWKIFGMTTCGLSATHSTSVSPIRYLCAIIIHDDSSNVVVIP